MNYEVKQTFSGRWANSTLHTHTHTHTHTQLLAQEPKWTIHNSIVDYQNSTTSPLLNVPNPDYTQNAIWDANGNLKVYEADGKIYNANGGLILDITDEAEAASFYDVDFGILSGFTEFIFVPVPGDCSKYYGITTYSTGGYSINPSTYVSDIVWCVIDVTLSTAQVIPQTGLRINKIDVNCDNRGPELQMTKGFEMHIEVTKKIPNGNRYLFASNSNCVSALLVNGVGIQYIEGYQAGKFFQANLRSEMEVLENGNVYELAMPCYGAVYTNASDYLSIFTFDMTTPSQPIMNHYDVQINSIEGRSAFVKGLEFSDDGLTLYASIVSVDIQNNSTFVGDNIVYLERANLGQSFSFGGVFATGSQTSDFGVGMIEKGLGNTLWFAGNQRLGMIPNSNTPIGPIQMMPVINYLSQAGAYSNGDLYNNPPLYPPTYMDVIGRQLYLLVDQIDGEDYTNWTTGSDLYPSVIEVCSFPYTFPYMIPSGAIVTYSGPSTSSGVLLGSGVLSISYQLPNGCEYTETINIILKEERWCDDAKFTRSITESVEPDVPVTAVCDILGVTNHEFYLYESDGQGGWIFLDSCFSASCILTGLYNGQSFKIVHNIYNINSTCHPFVTSTQYFTIN